MKKNLFFSSIIFFSLFVWAGVQPQEQSQLIIYRQQIGYVYLARAMLFADRSMTHTSVISVQARIICEFLHDQENEHRFPGDKRSLSADRIGHIVETFNQIESISSSLSPSSFAHLLETAADTHFIGEVVEIVLPKIMENRGVRIDPQVVYDTLAAQSIIGPDEPEFNLAKIQNFLEGRNEDFKSSLVQTLEYFTVIKEGGKQGTSLPLNQKVSLVLEIIKRDYPQGMPSNQLQAFSEGIEVMITDKHRVHVPNDIILLILEARNSVGSEPTVEKVIQQLEINFTRETKGERLALGHTTTAADVRERAINMGIIDQDAQEFSESRITGILFQGSANRDALGERAAEVLKRPITDSEKEAIWKAHKVGEGQPGKDGTPARLENYTTVQMQEKRQILLDAGFTESEGRNLRREGIVGLSAQQGLESLEIPLGNDVREAVRQAGQRGIDEAGLGRLRDSAAKEAEEGKRGKALSERVMREAPRGSSEHRGRK